MLTQDPIHGEASDSHNEGDLPTRKSKCTVEQIAYRLTQAEAGVPVDELCRNYGISGNTF